MGRSRSTSTALAIAHSDKEDAAATWKTTYWKTYGHRPLAAAAAFVDHDQGGTGEPVAALLRPGNAGSSTAADHITTAQLALAQLPKKDRRGHKHGLRRRHPRLRVLAREARPMAVLTVGMLITETIHQQVLKIPAPAWTPAVEADGKVRNGAWVAELTDSPLDGRPKGMQLIVRKERPYPETQLGITDTDGMRITCFTTNTPDRPIAEVELRHRLRARAEDRIQVARSGEPAGR